MEPLKKADYLYTVFLSLMLVLVVYGFINYFLIMVSLVALSCVINFVVFVVKTRIKKPIVLEQANTQPIDFYKTDSKVTYYEHGFIHEQQQQKLANAK